LILLSEQHWNYRAYFTGAVEAVLGYLAGQPVRELREG